MQKWMEQYMHQVLQEWKNVQEWTDQVSVKEVLSDPDSTGAQHVKERVTTTTTHHSEASANSSKETQVEVQQQTDSTQVQESSSVIFKEEEKTFNEDVKGWVPWYVIVTALLGAAVVGFIWGIRKKKWLTCKGGF